MEYKNDRLFTTLVVFSILAFAGWLIYSGLSQLGII
jgi:hypothetical protein